MDRNIPETMLTQSKQMAPITVEKECSRSSVCSLNITQIDKVLSELQRSHGHTCKYRK